MIERLHPYILEGERPASKFPLGKLIIDVRATTTLSRDDVAQAIGRHANGDWGDVCDEDRADNDESVEEGFRLFSVYHDRNGVKFWIITEADRSITAVLLPQEY